VYRKLNLIKEAGKKKIVDTLIGGADEPTVYQIRLKGHLGPQRTDWSGGMTITLEDNGDTLMTGTVVYQAALHGLLRKVRDLRVPLISAVRVKPP
jgi:hypothetical protein